MKQSQSLQLKIGQSLTMTPQLQQAIRLLQLSTIDLQNEIQEVLDTNPMLEVIEENIKNDSNLITELENHSLGKFSSELKPNSNDIKTDENSTDDIDCLQNIPESLSVDTNWDDVYQNHVSSSSISNEDEVFETQGSNTESLQDHLMWQLNLTPFSDRDYTIGLAIIDDVQPCGILYSSVEDIFCSLKNILDEVDEDEVLAVLHRLQQFDPVGVASQDLAECLLIQLNQLSQQVKNQHSTGKTSGLESAKIIVRDHLSTLASHDYKALMRKLNIKESELKSAINLIQTTNPRPGENIGCDTTEYVIPDVFVSKQHDRWVVELNPEIAPKIRINNKYAGLVKRADSSIDNIYLKDNLQEARWFLKSLQSRNETLLKVSTAIIKKQQGFLNFGEEAMKPLVLHDIAETVEMHESTISRVTSNKYMHTPKGVFELKYFFSSHVSTDSGGECSSTAIRAIIKKFIAVENVCKPLSDSKIALLLGKQGINVARRTVAKYRESMSIPPSNERKQLI